MVMSRVISIAVGLGIAFAGFLLWRLCKRSRMWRRSAIFLAALAAYGTARYVVINIASPSQQAALSKLRPVLANALGLGVATAYLTLAAGWVVAVLRVRSTRATRGSIFRPLIDAGSL